MNNNKRTIYKRLLVCLLLVVSILIALGVTYVVEDKKLDKKTNELSHKISYKTDRLCWNLKDKNSDCYRQRVSIAKLRTQQKDIKNGLFVTSAITGVLLLFIFVFDCSIGCWKNSSCQKNPSCQKTPNSNKTNNLPETSEKTQPKEERTFSWSDRRGSSSDSRRGSDYKPRSSWSDRRGSSSDSRRSSDYKPRSSWSDRRGPSSDSRRSSDYKPRSSWSDRSARVNPTKDFDQKTTSSPSPSSAKTFTKEKKLNVEIKKNIFSINPKSTFSKPTPAKPTPVKTPSAKTLVGEKK